MEELEKTILAVWDLDSSLGRKLEGLIEQAQQEAVSAERNKFKSLLESIVANDKTPRYPYSEGKTEKRKNAFGQLPDSGRWLTPAEMAENYLKALQTKGSDE